MSRDAIPGFEIDDLVRRLAAGEELEKVRAETPSVSGRWFDRNESSLLRLAGKAPPEAPKVETAEPEPAKTKKPKK